jgi:alcohol dehydrogenase (NADP+)
MVYPDSWLGFQIEDPAKWTEFHLNDMKPKPFGDYDVDIKILACGVCASDLHTLSGGWGDQKFPLCCGHGVWGLLLSSISFRCNKVTNIVSQKS